MHQATEIRKLAFNTAEIKDVELVHIYLKGASEPLILNRDGRTFNLKIIISVSDVSDSTPAPKAIEL